MHHLHESRQIAERQQRQHHGQSIFGVELLTSENHGQEADTIAKARHQRPPARIRELSPDQSAGNQ
jgi:thiamine monophosphate kinase